MVRGQAIIWISDYFTDAYVRYSASLNEQNDRYFTDGIFKYIFLKMFSFRLKYSWIMVTKVQWTIN